MFRRFRYRRWLVAGLGIAALTVPTTALAGNVLDGRSPDTRDAALTAARSNVDPMIDKYLLRYGYTQSQIDAMRATPARTVGILARANPKTVTYLLWHGYTENQIANMLVDVAKQRTPQVPPTPVDGRSPDTIDAGVLAHSPVVTVVRDPGFQWGDFAIGGAAALVAMMLVVLSVRFLSNRQDRGQQTPVAAA